MKHLVIRNEWISIIFLFVQKIWKSLRFLRWTYCIVTKRFPKGTHHSIPKILPKIWNFRNQKRFSVVHLWKATFYNGRKYLLGTIVSVYEIGASRCCNKYMCWWQKFSKNLSVTILSIFLSPTIFYLPVTKSLCCWHFKNVGDRRKVTP